MLIARQDALLQGDFWLGGELAFGFLLVLIARQDALLQGDFWLGGEAVSGRAPTR